MTESKLDETFSTKQFCMDGYSKPFWKDRNKNGGGVILIDRDDIPCKEIKFDFVPPHIACLSIELNLRKTKWLVTGYYRPPSQKSKYFFYHLEKVLDSLLPKYDRFLLAGDFNCKDHEEQILNFSNSSSEKYCSC